MEGLRKYPPVFSQLRERVVPPQGAVLSGYAIPGGTYVGFNSIGNQLNQIYGDHVEEYHPERWLIDDKIRLKQMRRNLELVYGHGNSKCLGMNIANLELNKIVFGVRCFAFLWATLADTDQMFRRYDISFCNTDRPWKTRGDFVLKEFRVRLQHRDGGKHCSQSG
jgi:cytochrome P450